MSPIAPRDELNSRVEVTHQVIREAGIVAKQFFLDRDKLQVETKSEPQDVVSMADRDVEEMIRGGIRQHFPDDGFLGEEFGLESGTSDWLWVIDPIDGTSCFLNGMHAWCISIAITYRGIPVAGVVLDPNADELFSASQGQGTFVNGVPVSCHKASSLELGVMGVGTSHRASPKACVGFLEKLLDKGGMFVRNGSGALMISYVAAGRLIGYYEPHINAWDCLAGIVLVQEAGGWANNFLEGDGLLSGNPILVSAPGVEDAIRQLADI